jgi:uncharacterized membrane protein YgcG
MCYVVELVNRVISWLVLILGTVAAIIIVYAGFKLVTSGGNRHAKEDAKSMITNMIIGYVIVLAGWLLVDTGMKALLLDGETRLGMWNELSCMAQPSPSGRTYTPEMFEPDTSLPAPTMPGVGGSPDTGNQRLACTPLPNGEDNCIPQQNECRAAGGTPIIDSSSPRRVVICSYRSGGGGGGNDSGGGGSRPPTVSGAGACSPALIGRYFPQALIGSAQCIIRGESACGARLQSVTDIMRSDPQRRPFSFGAMQINITVHVLQGCGGATLNCPAAFRGKNYSARVVNENLYQQCAAAAQNNNCNILNGFRIYREAGNSWRPWSTARGCGLI